MLTASSCRNLAVGRLRSIHITLMITELVLSEASQGAIDCQVHLQCDAYCLATEQDASCM